MGKACYVGSFLFAITLSLRPFVCTAFEMKRRCKGMIFEDSWWTKAEPLG